MASPKDYAKMVESICGGVCGYQMKEWLQTDAGKAALAAINPTEIPTVIDLRDKLNETRNGL